MPFRSGPRGEQLVEEDVRTSARLAIGRIVEVEAGRLVERVWTVGADATGLASYK